MAVRGEMLFWPPSGTEPASEMVMAVVLFDRLVEIEMIFVPSLAVVMEAEVLQLELLMLVGKLIVSETGIEVELETME